MPKTSQNTHVVDESTIKALARSYNVLDYSHNYKKILGLLIPNVELDKCSKYELHCLINDLLIKEYRGENVLKARLVEMFAKKNVTAAFEIKVNNSRVDFLTVNGDTVSYEIKSRIDNLTKLSKQICDYEKTFEYNYIVIDEKHYASAVKLIPEHYGIYVLKKNKLIEDRKSKINKSLDASIQLSLFTKKELQYFFRSNAPEIDFIKLKYNETEINRLFKEMMKKRYLKKWLFLKDNLEQILPIDYQYFFNHNVNPSIIYDIKR